MRPWNRVGGRRATAGDVHLNVPIAYNQNIASAGSWTGVADPADSCDTLISLDCGVEPRSLDGVQDTSNDGLSTMPTPAESDIIIAVMGPTGTGKSTFVNKAAGVEGTHVGHSLESCTHDIQVVECFDKRGRRILLVDTPGFDDTNLSDLDILERIADWLKKTYERGITLSGLLFFHRISDNRMAGSPLKLLETFKKICGTQALVNVILVTTMWEDVEEDVGQIREFELRENYWKTMIASGSRTARFHNTYESGWEIISRIDPNCRRALYLQRELVDQKKVLTDTAAARTVLRWLTDMLEAVKKTIETAKGALRRRHRREKRRNLEQTISENEKKLEAVKNCISQYGWPRTESTLTLVSRSTSPVDCSTAEGDSLEDCLSPPNSPVDDRPQTSNGQILDRTVTALRIIEKLVGLAPIPGLSTAVGLLVAITEAMEKMESVDESLVALSQNACSMISTLVEIAQGGVNHEVEGVIKSFLTDLRAMNNVVQGLANHGTAKRFFQSNSDRQAIEECNWRLILGCHRVGLHVAFLNNAHMNHLEDKLDHVIQLLMKPARLPESKVMINIRDDIDKLHRLRGTTIRELPIRSSTT